MTELGPAHQSSVVERIRVWGPRIVFLLAAISFLAWLLGRDRLPWQIRIASGEEGGVYHMIGEALAESVQKNLGREPKVLTTSGSVDNFDLLTRGEAELAIIQGGAAKLEEAAVITPLYPEWMIVLARKDRGIQRAFDLIGKRVAIGKQGSGMRESATNLLSHMNISPEDYDGAEVYFAEILTDTSIDAAIVTTGILNQDLRRVLRTEQFDIVPIRDARALALTDPYFQAVEIPRGALCERPSMPAEPTSSLSTYSYLAVKEDASDQLVSAALKAIHEENLRLKAPTLILRAEAPALTTTRFHKVAQKYFHPDDQLGWMANVMESLAAGKELLFAIGAGIYLLWRRWRALKEKEVEEALSAQKEHLDLFMEQTLAIEAAQAETDDINKLYEFLNAVTDIKLKALHEFTEEELRADQVFRIFLAQCANLISKIQLKILSLKSGVG